MMENYALLCRYCEFGESDFCGPGYHCAFQTHYLGKLLEDNEELPYKSFKKEDCRVTNKKRINRADGWGYYEEDETR